MGRNFRKAVPNISITYDTATNSITSCNSTIGPENLCKNMGCNWDNSKEPMCTCGYTPDTCPNGQVVKRLNAAGKVVCESILSECPAGQVATGYANEALVCTVPGQWLVNAWSPCVGGTQTRNATCVNPYAPDITKPLDESFCQYPAPPISRACISASTQCTVANFTWTVSGKTCTAAGDVLTNNQTLTVTADTSTNTGQAKFTRTAGVLSAPTAATCVASTTQGKWQCLSNAEVGNSCAGLKWVCLPSNRIDVSR